MHQARTQHRPRKTYKVDLREQMACCEGNYLRLMKLMPEFDDTQHWHYETTVGDNALSLTLEITERAPYTTMLNVSQCSGVSDWCVAPEIQVRLYHDVRMAEVVAWREHRRLQVRYAYPNKAMYQQDEKSQQNQYLADCLRQLLDHGHMPIDAALSSGP